MQKDPFSHQIIGLAMESHRVLGPGLVEEFYHQDLVSRLTKAGLEHLSKPRRDLIYRGHVADTFEADIVFPNKLIPELKVLRGGFDAEHFTQILSYSKFWQICTGMLMDFGKASFIPKRVIYTSKTAKFPLIEVPSFVSNPALAKDLIEIATCCLADIGLGYRPTTWSGLISAALRAESVPFTVNPAATVTSLGMASLDCIVIQDQAAISVSALGDEVTAMNRARLQTCLRWLDLPWGICFHFGKSAADLTFVSHPKNHAPYSSIL
jgi:GxxExxY protein